MLRNKNENRLTASKLKGARLAVVVFAFESEESPIDQKLFFFFSAFFRSYSLLSSSLASILALSSPLILSAVSFARASASNSSFCFRRFSRNCAACSSSSPCNLLAIFSSSRSCCSLSRRSRSFWYACLARSSSSFVMSPIVSSGRAGKYLAQLTPRAPPTSSHHCAYTLIDLSSLNC